MKVLYIALTILSLQQCIEAKRDGKLLSLFNIVSFPNDPCDAGTKNGTCYTQEECSNKGGTNDGSCASGYGVCCTFAVKCGTTIAENNTYFESGGSEVGSCNVKICPCSSNICQLRLDFDTFSITGPSTSTASTFTKILGGSTNSAGEAVSPASRCLTDIFTVTNPGGRTPPSICGTNSNQHMYVDSSTACNDLNFLLGEQAAEGSTLATRSWSIRVTQLECGSETLAPAGCTQYFYGGTTGTLKTFNFDGGKHLADQNQVQCIRREKGNCKICYTTDTFTDFSVSGAIADKFVTKSCCGYGMDGKKSFRDCVIIPSLSFTKGTKVTKAFQNFCGMGGLGTKSTVVDATKNKTLCSKRQPFQVTFNTDSWEYAGAMKEATFDNKGYQLKYIQSSNNC